MSFIRIVSLFCAIVCAAGLFFGVLAAEVDCDSTYCFTAEDFSETGELTGICITGLPDSSAGTVLLGNRVLRSGDILTAEQVGQMTFAPLRTEEDAAASVTYLPIYENRVAPSATMTISIKGKTDQPPVAEDLALETYKNLPNDGILKASVPEGEALTYTVIRQPKRGEVTVREDGSFTYTPKKNKVGVDSFTYTATDTAGKVSREATVTVQILKPTDSRQYADTAGTDCRFEAEWLKNTGLFTGETVSGESCFCPEKTVSRGDFLAMAVKVLDIPLEEEDLSAISTDVPLWLKPYVGAALRSGLLEGWPETQTGSFEADQPITGAEAAVMLQNALDLTRQNALPEQDQIPVWAADSLAVMAENGIALAYDQPLTRGQTAKVLYQVSALALTAPGTAVFALQ
ncbi:MAG: cadherin-like domain-containing protein [Oscillospiraceae bacterium]|nr:cadherin-like domain-containing protein [Oscillospiraceae bacterium]